mgnify:CR=1 FL=1
MRNKVLRLFRADFKGRELSILRDRYFDGAAISLDGASLSVLQTDSGRAVLSALRAGWEKDPLPQSSGQSITVLRRRKARESIGSHPRKITANSMRAARSPMQISVQLPLPSTPNFKVAKKWKSICLSISARMAIKPISCWINRAILGD